MLNSAEKIQTSHAGSLPRTPELIEANTARVQGQEVEGFEEFLADQVAALVRRQVETGITVVGDGEYGKAMTSPMDFGAWWSYIFQRTSGLELDEHATWITDRYISEPGNIGLTGFGFRRDQQAFRAAYADPDSGIFVGQQPNYPKVTGPISYTGGEAVAADAAHLRAAADAAGVQDAFITSLAPGSASRIGNEYYTSDEDLLAAWADVMREEYLAVLDAGLILQIDDPSIAENWDQIEPEPSLSDYLAFTQLRVEALNHALRDLPADRIRYHLCWGSWHGPHTTDLPMRDIISTVLTVNAGAITFEAGNVRHEHEYTVWDEVRLPEDKLILPGVVSHATNVVEHPELVAQRIERFATRVGRENVIAATDCGLGGRVHADIAWAKLATLAQGADLATQRLYR